jgi:hypothetical protein
MKQVKFFATPFLAAGIIFFSSCNSKGDKKADENKTDSTGTKTETKVTPAAGPGSVMIIRHQVADYAKWKVGYDGHDSARLANGVHSYLIARGIENDSNTVLVATRMDDVNKAKAMVADPAMQEVMKKAGVIGKPVIDYIEAVMNDTTAITQTVRCMVRHEVTDWDAWKKVYDADQPARQAAGLTDRVLAHTVGDTHNVTIVFAVADVAKAKAFASSKSLADKMKEGGVKGPPDMFFYKIVQKY